MFISSKSLANNLASANESIMIDEIDGDSKVDSDSIVTARLIEPKLK